MYTTYWGRAKTYHLIAIALLVLGTVTAIGCFVIWGVYVLLGAETTVDWGRTAVLMSWVSLIAIPVSRRRDKLQREQDAVLAALNGEIPGSYFDQWENRII